MRPKDSNSIPHRVHSRRSEANGGAIEPVCATSRRTPCASSAAQNGAHSRSSVSVRDSNFVVPTVMSATGSEGEARRAERVGGVDMLMMELGMLWSSVKHS